MPLAAVRTMLLVLSLLLGGSLASLRPAPTLALAQDDAARFADVIAARDRTSSAAGPLAGELAQDEANVATADAGIPDANFSATATFENPQDPGSVPWDIGFLFHPTNETSQQLFIDSDGAWYYVDYPNGIQDSGTVANFDAAPGAENRVDLIVENDVALLGVNGDFVASVTLPADGATGVRVGTGFLTSTTDPGRVVPYRDFEVWPLPAESGTPSLEETPSSNIFQITVTPETTPATEETPSSNIFRITVTPEATETPSPEVTETPSPADAAEFASLLDAQRQAATIAGPFSANLKEEPDRIAQSWAGVNLADFHAHAQFAVPAIESETPWDIGFTFRTSPSGPLHVTVDSLGNWYYSIGNQGPADRGTVTGVLTAPGASNTLDLLVAGQRALLGLNGTFVTAIELPPDASAADVAASVAVFSDQTVADRVTPFQDFTILAYAPTGVAPTETPAPSFSAADRDEFAGYVDDTRAVVPALGPFSGRLVESTVGVVPQAFAGTSLADFGAVASFTNPDDVTTTPWDAGLQFRSTGDQVHRVIVRSTGEVYAVFPDGTTTLAGTATAYDSAPGAVNELQLFVSGTRALFGVNDALAAVIELPGGAVASDIVVGTAFLSEDFAQGRITGYNGFSVWEIS